MKTGMVVRRFLVPSVVVTVVCRMKFGSYVSRRAEVELTRHLKMGRGTVVGPFTKIKATNGPLQIGRNVEVGSHVSISAQSGGIEIGDGSVIEPHVAITSANYRYDDLTRPIQEQERVSKGVRIGDNVRIGAGTSVLDGAVIGSGSTIAPLSVVSTTIPDNAAAGGDPCKVLTS